VRRGKEQYWPTGEIRGDMNWREEEVKAHLISKRREDPFH